MEESNVPEKPIEVEAPVLVLDVPFGTTPEEATRLIGEPYERGFYIHRAMEWPGGARVVYIHRVKPVTNPDASTPTPKPEPVQTREARALQFLRDNREMSLNGLAGAFKALGFPRSSVWIGKKRAEVIRAERRVS